MPVLVLSDRCDHLPNCYAATACPNQALLYDAARGQVIVLPERCGDCRGPCLNFCDRYALKYAPSLEELRLLQAELDGTMSAEEIVRQRALIRQAQEARQQAHIPEVTAATFQQEVLQARLPVLLIVDSPRSGNLKRLAPTLEQMSQKWMGQLLIRRVNSDAELQLTAALRVRTVPTFFLFAQGQLLAAVEGGLSPAQLQAWVQNVLQQWQAVEQSQGKAASRPAGPTLFRKG